MFLTPEFYFSSKILTTTQIQRKKKYLKKFIFRKVTVIRKKSEKSTISKVNGTEEVVGGIISKHKTKNKIEIEPLVQIL
jgi:hypothetical protein